MSARQAPVTIIRPPEGWTRINFRELWQYRELLYFMTWRDIKVRYKQTLAGLAWAILQPLFMMVVFSLFFGVLAQIPSGNIPYPLFVYSGLLPWTLFAAGVSRSSNSLVQDANLIQKVYFPRLIIPLAGIFSPLLDFVMAFIVLIPIMIYFGHMPGPLLLLAIPFMIVEIVLVFGISLWMSAINIEYRDISQIIPFAIQILLFASPVIYSSNFVPARFQIAYGLLNPMAGIIEGFRWAILGTEPASYLIFDSIIISLVLLISGLFFFTHREKRFSDIV